MLNNFAFKAKYTLYLTRKRTMYIRKLPASCIESILWFLLVRILSHVYKPLARRALGLYFWPNVLGFRVPVCFGIRGNVGSSFKSGEQIRIVYIGVY